MTKQQVNSAEWLANEFFSDWNKVANAVEPGTGIHYEILDVINDAVHIGIHMALYGVIEMSGSAREIKKQKEYVV